METQGKRMIHRPTYKYSNLHYKVVVKNRYIWISFCTLHLV